MMRTLLAAALLAGASTTPSSVASAQISTGQNSAFNPAGDSRWEKTVPVIASGAWTGPTLADGQPDVSGNWSNTISNHGNFTDPQAGDPGDPTKEASLPRDQRAPSRVSDPADGQIPYLPAARALQQNFEREFPEPSHAWQVEPLARCAPAGVPKSFMWHGYEIRQYPGVVLLLFDSGTRIIHLDDAAHLADPIKLWNGDSHGHWEGNTLVVEVTNNNGKALFGRTGDFMSENGTVVERYVFDNAGERFNYVATFTDPTVYARPWTATIPARRYTEANEPDGWHYDASVANRPGQPLLRERLERICVENNGPSDGGLFDLPPDGPVIER